ncbi:b-glycosyltransferase [Constantimarinum furrinae]|uniref:B-glycosyltransferase n=2 Tax=Constantimarinum furrinae TaxID=2562285 RepID=A0A7G8PTX7_9FLAO|nr:b-glycosyltransferase [Constantimarinum furrinae]
MELPDITMNMKQLKCCVVIPTYNNNKTLKKVLDGVLEYTSDIVLVNDGSTDNTLHILEKYPQIEQIHIPKNKGKGNALKLGFKYAVGLGYDYAITLDSDGQHFPSDIPVFIEELVKSDNKNMLLIGDRNMNEADVLARSRKGNRVSTYWVKAVTGLDLKDSQSGFRLYPIKALDKIRFFRNTKKFEFEVEVIVKAHWSDIEVKNVPINILYDQSERVSHFRPFMDIARIVVLIIWFLLVKLFYIIPRNFIRRLKKKGIKRFFLEDFLRNGDSPRKKALSIALGVFIGLSPLWGFHTIIVIFLAILLKLNKVIAFAFSNISLPPFIPFVLLLSLQTGNLVLGQDTYVAKEDLIADFDLLSHLEAYLIGSITLSVTAAVVSGVIGYLVLSVLQPKKIIANG